jgi:hypothetical protein
MSSLRFLAGIEVFTHIPALKRTFLIVTYALACSAVIDSYLLGVAGGLHRVLASFRIAPAIET